MSLGQRELGSRHQLRPGITMSNESTSFIRSAFAAPGTLQNTTGNFPWVSAETNAIPGVSVNGEKVVYPLRLLAREISYTSPELDRSQLTGQPIDVQKIDAMNILYQMNTDQMVYIGSSDVGATGLINDAGVTANRSRRASRDLLSGSIRPLMRSWLT